MFVILIYQSLYFNWYIHIIVPYLNIFKLKYSSYIIETNCKLIVRLHESWIASAWMQQQQYNILTTSASVGDMWKNREKTKEIYKIYKIDRRKDHILCYARIIVRSIPYIPYIMTFICPSQNYIKLHVIIADHFDNK